jgi:hypothetical protein
LFSMSCLYFFRLVPCLFTKAPSRYAIVCSMKKLTIISWNRHVVIHLGSCPQAFDTFRFVSMKCSPCQTFL